MSFPEVDLAHDRKIEISKKWVSFPKIDLSHPRKAKILEKYLDDFSRKFPNMDFKPLFLANDILRVSFDYRNYEMAKKSITGGASFQSILLQSDSTQIENIGIAIYQMHRYYSGKSRDFVLIRTLIYP